MKILLIAIAASAAILISGCSRGPEWINVGTRINEVEKDNITRIQKIKYRLYDFRSVPKNIDMVDFKLQVQSGAAIGEEVMLAVYECFAPDVRNGLPTVMCSSQSMGDVHLAGNDVIRSKLLHMKDGQAASLIGRARGIYGSNAIVEIL